MGVTALKHSQWHSPDEYLALEREAEFKSEYLCGVIYAMAGGSPIHGEIGVNVCAEIRQQLKGSGCHTFSSDVRICTDDSGLYAYPDVSVVCGEPQYHDNHKDVITNPMLIVEVLSPNTEAYDRGKKFEMYKRIESFTDYVLVSQNEPMVTHYVRQPKAKWLSTTVQGLEGTLEIESLGCKLLLSEVYYNIEFSDEGLEIETDPRHGINKIVR